jgi:hypothetical protein
MAENDDRLNPVQPVEPRDRALFDPGRPDAVADRP